MGSEPWYRDGLRFSCTQCGNCCTGAPGFVWVTPAEIAALARRMGCTEVEDFERRFVRAVGMRKSLCEYPDGDCIFFDAEARRCLVYEDRPQQCRNWPFWQANVQTRQDWQRVCEICPGSGRGQFYTLQQIQARAEPTQP